jgi:hypothetical protein
MKTCYGQMEVQLHTFLTWTLYKGEWLALRPCRFTPRKRAPVTHWIGVWMSPRVGLGAAAKDKNSFCASAANRTSIALSVALLLYWLS